MEPEKRNPILSVDIQIEIRGALREISFTRVLKMARGFGVCRRPLVRLTA